MIAISIMSSEYKQVFSSTEKLIAFIYNRLKNNIIEISKYLNT